MKWDIMDAYYPLSMLSADMLRAGKLPLWNAALQFGCPTYIILGAPYWYPTTLFFELTTGYTLISTAWEYCIHIVLACFGMFLLVKSHLRDAENIQSFMAAAIAGALYGYSGLFVSNAQHIMIIISAAWLPYILLMIKKYLETNIKLFLMVATLCMGLSILGGYPEVWVATFIILIPYSLTHIKKENLFVPVLKAAASYIIFASGALAVAAISVVPFLMSSDYIDRLGGGVNVNSFDVLMILSGILPHYTGFAKELGQTLDISMISIFMGLLTIILIGISFFRKIKYKCQYLFLAAFAFLMMLGNNSFLHPVFQRFFPLFNSLRFPSLWRCVLTVFLLILAAETLEDILGNEGATRMFIRVCLLLGTIFLGLYIAMYLLPIKEEIVYSLRMDFKLDCFVCFLYAILMIVVLRFQKLKGNNVVLILAVGAIADIFAGQYYLYSLTVTQFNQWKPEQISEAQLEMRGILERDRNRTHSIDYSLADRSKKGLDSQGIVFNHSLDEEGYLSVLLNYIQIYKSSEHCRLSSEVPEIYVTNDVVSGTDVDYDAWLQDTGVSPYQIYIEESHSNFVADLNLDADVSTDYFIGGDIQLIVSQNLPGYLVIQQTYYPGWYAYIDGVKADIEKINGVFLGLHLEKGEHKIRFVFRPLDFYIGMIITLGYLILCIIVLIQYCRAKKKDAYITALGKITEKGIDIG